MEENEIIDSDLYLKLIMISDIFSIVILIASIIALWWVVLKILKDLKK